MEERVPREFDTLRATILERREVLPRRIAQIAAYALDNPDDIAFGTAASIAAAAGVQPSTLVRFAQQFGFDGFTSLQSVFRERLRERNSSYDERLAALREKAEGEGGHRAILEGFVTAAVTSLEDVSRALDEKRLEKAIALLAQAGRSMCWPGAGPIRSRPTSPMRSASCASGTSSSNPRPG